MDNRERSPLFGKSSRDAYGIVFNQLAEQDDRIVAVTADVPGSVRFSDFIEKHPERAFNFGIAEQNMMSAAAGLARSGKIPFVSLYAIFAALRAAEQARTDVAYGNLPVRICVTHAGISLGPGGPSHHSIEDIAIYRSMPNMTVVAPADSVGVAMAMEAVKDLPGPVYMRLSRAVEPPVYPVQRAYEVGKANLVRPGKDVTILAYGSSVGYALITAGELAKDGIDAGVVDMAFIKPLDEEMVIQAAEQTGALLTVEEHSIVGGLGSAVAEVIAEKGMDVRFKRHGIPDVFTLAGSYPDLLRHYKLDAEGIQDAVLALL